MGVARQTLSLRSFLNTQTEKLTKTPARDLEARSQIRSVSSHHFETKTLCKVRVASEVSQVRFLSICSLTDRFGILAREGIG